MLIPIGHADMTVRRLPWVTFTIMAACVVAFVLTAISPSGEVRVANRERAALKYYVEHPYLQLAGRLKGYQYYSMLQAAGENRAQPPADRHQLDLEQRELDGLTALVFEAIDDIPAFRWGLVPARISLPAIITYMFMHGGLLHLLGNLFFLYLVGPSLEDAWGRPLFAGFYLTGGVVAGLLYAATFPHLEGPLIGASGAIAAVMGAFALRFFRTKIRFFYFFFFFRFYYGTFEAPAWLMLGLWSLRELLYAQGWGAVTSVGDAGNVAYLAHVAGFAFGLAMAFAARLLQIEERFVTPALEAKETVFQNIAVERAVDAARAGRGGEAMRSLRALLVEKPEDFDAAAALWGVAVAEGTVTEAAPLMVTALRRAAREGDAGLIRARWPELLRQAPDLQVDLSLSVRCAELLRGCGALEEAAETVEWVKGRLPASPSVALLVRLARLAHGLHLPAAATFAALARRDPALTLAAAVELDRLGVEAVAGQPARGPGIQARPARAGAPLKVVEARPLELGTDALELEVGGSRRSLPLAQVRAVAVAEIAAPDQPGQVVVDLLLDRPDEAVPPLRAVRLGGGALDPRSLVGGSDPREALSRFVARVLELSRARALLGGAPSPGGPLRTYASFEEYERDLTVTGAYGTPLR